ncbi:dihydropteroate synthase [Bifidobacterium boum]|uniref:Dihydropteroate synthase n=1 Tax=Bifidobacterium boum TaxID=78343 RepID=A0A848D7N7_9BIFI|nr:dihydropteroate synthase [Bifidobacterium boum]NMF02723.1 dihydropteroate synthase [Bifidobacterium boum]
MDQALQALHDAPNTMVMGVLNITEDSFSDGGKWLDPQAAAEHGQALAKAGAQIIDIGAESTRPGAKRVSEQDELNRVLGAVHALADAGVPLSIDTTRASVAEAALEAGASIINDVSGGRLDPQVPQVVAEHDCLYIVQHWRSWLSGSQGATPDADTSVYAGGVMHDVREELLGQVDDVLAAGVRPEQIIIDPGLGFSKPSAAHNFPLLVGLDTLRASGYPVLIGASRKRFLADAGIDAGNMAARDDATAALSAMCAEHGAWAVRVHDVAKSLAAVTMGTMWRTYANA